MGFCTTRGVGTRFEEVHQWRPPRPDPSAVRRGRLSRWLGALPLLQVVQVVIAGGLLRNAEALAAPSTHASFRQQNAVLAPVR